MGYRSPYWDYSENTLDLLEEAGFLYDSSLMARDLVPYHPQRWQVNWETEISQARPARFWKFLLAGIWMIFPHWRIPATEGMSDTDGVLRRWKDIFTYAYNHQENGLYAMALHPQIIGHGHHMMMLSRLIEHIKGHDGVWFATCEEIASVWVDDEEDRQKCSVLMFVA